MGKTTGAGYNNQSKLIEAEIQTKFTPFRTGKDPKNYPYDTAASIEEQVEQSINTSLENFQTNYLDCLILHDPCSTLAETLSVWKAMSQHVPHSVFHLGASNIGLSDLEAICATEVKPILVQNRFTPDSANNLSPGLPPGISTPSDAFDKAVRQHCATHDLTYQPWGVLWGNKSLIASESLGTIAELLEVSKEIAFYLCVASLLDCRVSILTGTKTFSRMKDDVDGFRDFEDVRARIMEEGGRLLACCKDLQMAIG